MFVAYVSLNRVDKCMTLHRQFHALIFIRDIFGVVWHAIWLCVSVNHARAIESFNRVYTSGIVNKYDTSICLGLRM